MKTLGSSLEYIMKDYPHTHIYILREGQESDNSLISWRLVTNWGNLLYNL